MCHDEAWQSLIHSWDAGHNKGVKRGYDYVENWQCLQPEVFTRLALRALLLHDLRTGYPPMLMTAHIGTPSRLC